jgi:hypothetical protein
MRCKTASFFAKSKLTAGPITVLNEALNEWLAHPPADFVKAVSISQAMMGDTTIPDCAWLTLLYESSAT